VADRAFAICDCLMRPSTSSGVLGLTRPQTVGKVETPCHTCFGNSLWHSRNNSSIRKNAPTRATNAAIPRQGGGATAMWHGANPRSLVLQFHLWIMPLDCAIAGPGLCVTKAPRHHCCAAATASQRLSFDRHCRAYIGDSSIVENYASCGAL
jgi:hypothetical protein